MNKLCSRSPSRLLTRQAPALALAAIAVALAGGCERPPLSAVRIPGPDAGPDAGSVVACGSVVELLRPIPPDVLLVLDKSGSMNDEPDGKHCQGGCGLFSKWTQMTVAIEHVVGTTASVNWGLKLFATPSLGCNVDDGVEVPVGPSNAAAITSVIAQAKLGSHTPTRFAESNGAAYLATLTDQRPKYLLLATDGLPNCDPINPSMMADDSAGAEQAVADALAAGFPTFVIGLGNTMAEATLNQLALRGGVPQTGAATSYYQVSDTTGLVAAFGRILGSVSCVFDLPVPTNSLESTENIAVLANGAALPRDADHVNGWDYITGTTQIQIFGPTCNALMAAKVADVAVQFLCPA
jgi:hypothetical protein